MPNNAHCCFPAYSRWLQQQKAKEAKNNTKEVEKGTTNQKQDSIASRHTSQRYTRAHHLKGDPSSATPSNQRHMSLLETSGRRALARQCTTAQQGGIDPVEEAIISRLEVEVSALRDMVHEVFYTLEHELASEVAERHKQVSEHVHMIKMMRVRATRLAAENESLRRSLQGAQDELAALGSHTRTVEHTLASERRQLASLIQQRRVDRRASSTATCLLSTLWEV
jgi:hypothetical protein